MGFDAKPSNGQVINPLGKSPFSCHYYSLRSFYFVLQKWLLFTWPLCPKPQLTGLGSFFRKIMTIFHWSNWSSHAPKPLTVQASQSFPSQPLSALGEQRGAAPGVFAFTVPGVLITNVFKRLVRWLNSLNYFAHTHWPEKKNMCRICLNNPFTKGLDNYTRKFSCRFILYKLWMAMSHPKHNHKMGKDFWDYPRAWWQEPAQIFMWFIIQFSAHQGYGYISSPVFFSPPGFLQEPLASSYHPKKKKKKEWKKWQRGW